MNIRLSDKHGVNPSVGLCFICGESHSVLLYGKLKGDAEAPRETVHGFCKQCEDKITKEKKIACIQVTSDREEGETKRTGPVFFIHEDDWETLPVGKDLTENGKKARIVWIDKEAWEALFFPDAPQGVEDHGTA